MRYSLCLIFRSKETTPPAPFGHPSSDSKNTSRVQRGGICDAEERSGAGRLLGEGARSSRAYRSRTVVTSAPLAPANNSRAGLCSDGEPGQGKTALLLRSLGEAALRNEDKHVINIQLGAITLQWLPGEFVSLRKADWT